MNVSYIRILNAFEAFAQPHLQIKRFASDFPEQMPNFATEKENYPILFVSPSNSIFDENANQFTVTVYCFDVIEKDRSNINTILSDTNTILNDVYRWFKDGDIYGIDVIDNAPSVLPINNALLDYAAGWQMQLTFTVDTYGICEIPFNEAPVVITEVCDIVYSQYLTCETLAACSTIIALEAVALTEDQFDAVNAANAPTGANPFATMADLTGGGESLAATLAIGNTTNQIAITSNNGNSSALVFNAAAALGFNNGDVDNYFLANVNQARLSYEDFLLTVNGYLELNANEGKLFHSVNITLDSPILQYSSDSGAFAQSWIYADTISTGLGFGFNNILSITAVSSTLSHDTQISILSPIVALSDEVQLEWGDGVSTGYLASNSGYAEKYFQTKNTDGVNYFAYISEDAYADATEAYWSVEVRRIDLITSDETRMVFKLDAANNQAFFQNNNPLAAGIEYSADYSANYTNRSLVDKEYVDSLTPPAPTLASVLAVGNTTNGIAITSNDTTSSISIFNGSLTLTGTTAYVNGLTIGKGTANVLTNTAFGIDALLANTTGSSNVGIGYETLKSNQATVGNVAIGRGALKNHNQFDGNTAIGYLALTSQTAGQFNVAIGYNCMPSNLTGNGNLGLGTNALRDTQTGSDNTAIGYNAMLTALAATDNVAIGKFALGNAGNGLAQNTVIGNNAGSTIIAHANNTVVGYNAFTTNTGNDCTVIGRGMNLPANGDGQLVLGANGTRMILGASTGAITIPNLAGTGTQMVTADINGVLSKQAIPVSPTIVEFEDCTIDGQGGVIVNNSKATIVIPYTGTITGWTLLEISDTPISSTVTLDAWKDSYSNYPPTIADTIFGTKPFLSAAIKNQATGLSIAVTAGDIIIVNVDSALLANKLKFGFNITRA